MFIHKIVTPMFIRRFECVGSECLSHCCQDWFISIDKKTYKKYHSAESIEIKQISREHVLKSEREGAYAYVRLTEDKKCPFLTEKRLCNVYSKLGPSAMSHTCREYPRSEAKYQNATFKRLSLSCPEAVRQLLFSADAMQLTEEDKYLKKAPQDDALTDPQYLVYLWCLNLVQAQSPEFEDNLYAAMQLLTFISKLNYDIEANFDRIQGVYEFLLNAAESGKLTAERRALPHPAAFQTAVLSVYGKFIPKLSWGGDLLLSVYINTLRQLGLDDQQTAERTEENMARLRAEWKVQQQESCLSEPYTLRNLFSYLLYHGQFPHADNFSGGVTGSRNALSHFSLLVMDYFYLRTNLAALAATGKRVLKENDIQLLMSAYFSLKMHTGDINTDLLALMENCQMSDAVACICLLDS
ncbi:lysine-N-methylase [Morganella morganii]|uniref:Lysine-N-methylase n=1 Tax=Morganella morganii TaxID=582 RepID=A0A433ZXU9_MORMO|nr:flagellin lysine-N-methylase [Morganella morganii]RUT66939.1 lysine-N-methylase [Morganella morganii]